MKHIITLAALIAAHTIAAAGPLPLTAQEARTAPRLYAAIPTDCVYGDILAAVLLGKLAPSIPALTGRGCSADAALAHLLRMEDEQHIERVAGGWRVK